MRRHLRTATAYIRLAQRRATSVVRAWRSNALLRDRVACVSAFAFIFVFFTASVDYLVTGGPDWNPGAEAAELPRAYAQRVEAAPLQLPNAEAPPPEIEPIAFENYAIATETLLGGPESDAIVELAPLAAQDFPFARHKGKAAL